MGSKGSENSSRSARRLAELIAVAPPPRDPVASWGDWGSLERRLGLELPEDFKALIETYGSGSFSDFLVPINPFRGTGLEWADRNILRFDREIRAEFPREMPYPIHPEPGGILPWATTDNGDVLYWLTAGDTWPILVRDSRGPETAVYPFGAAEFLLRWLSGKLVCPIFTGWDVQSNPGFYPVRDLRPVTVHFAHVDGSFDERLRLLMNHFGPNCMRRRSSSRQTIFQADPSGIKVTYTDLGEAYGSWLALSYPPEDERHHKELVREIQVRLDWPIWRVSEKSWADIPITRGPRLRRQAHGRHHATLHPPRRDGPDSGGSHRPRHLQSDSAHRPKNNHQ
jgi:hypothetical protein